MTASMGKTGVTHNPTYRVWARYNGFGVLTALAPFVTRKPIGGRAKAFRSTTTCYNYVRVRAREWILGERLFS